MFFPKPNSYTGDDVVEFHVHGSNAVVKYFLEVLSKFKNCRLAKPGEFTKTALLNKKINLLQAESLIDLINSETELQRTQALRVMNDDTTKVYNNLRADLIKILYNFIKTKKNFNLMLNVIKFSEELSIYTAKINGIDNRLSLPFINKLTDQM